MTKISIECQMSYVRCGHANFEYYMLQPHISSFIIKFELWSLLFHEKM